MNKKERKMKRLPRSLRKYLRSEKARIRSKDIDSQKQQEEIKKLLARFYSRGE